MTSDTRYEALIAVDSIPEARGVALQLNGQCLLVCRSGGQVFAIENRCSHQDSPLENGRVRNGFISCPLHGVRFELATGKPMGQLTRTPIRTYPVRIVNETVEVALGAEQSVSEPSEA